MQKNAVLFDGTEGRQLVWYDEFDDTSLNTSTMWKFYQTMGAFDRKYRNGSDNVNVANGTVTLTAKKNTGRGQPYTLPQGLTTKDRMIFTYGYLEMRAKIPFKRGAWPSFWMRSDQRYGKADYMAEIDIFEVFSSNNTLESTLHKWKRGLFGQAKAHDQWSTTYKNVNRKYTFKDFENLNNEFHLYGFEWTSEHMAFYVDNQLYLKIDLSKDFATSVSKGMQGFHDPCYIIMNNELITNGNYNSSWMSSDWLCQDSDLPIEYVIDYVRLYQKNGETIQTQF